MLDSQWLHMKYSGSMLSNYLYDNIRWLSFQITLKTLYLQ